MSEDLARAAAQAEARIASGERHPHLYNIAAWARADAGDSAGAFELLERARQLAPDDPQTLTSLAAIYRRAGRLRDAVLHCDAAIKLAPGYADAWLERGFVFASGGSMARARECYEKVLALDPDNPPAHAGLASLDARDGNFAAGRSHAQSALRGDPANATAMIALATIELEQGAAEIARDLLSPLVAGMSAPSGDRSLGSTLLGNAYARLGEAEQAFVSYARANADFAAIHAEHFAGRPPLREFVEAIGAAVATRSFRPPVSISPPRNAASRHIFLLGYPRSGNTLVENILASLPEVTALEERPTLRLADQEFLADPAKLALFAALDARDLERYRQDYWDKVREAGLDVNGRTFVDMDPLKGTRLPLIARLFPSSRVVIMRRDPRDVVWSCFRTNFALTNTAMEFTTLEGTAQHFDAMMRLIETARERLPLAFHELRYERLIRDFEATTKDLCAFAGLAWDTSMRRFDVTAKRRGVATASGGQIRRGLYDGGRQWQPFAEWLEPVMPILRPWLDRFGYE